MPGMNKEYIRGYIADIRKDINNVIKKSHDDEARKELRRINSDLNVVVKGLSE